MDHWSALKDTQTAIEILDTLKEILSLALSYKPLKATELRKLENVVKEEIIMQKKLQERLEEKGSLGQAYLEEREDIKVANREAIGIKTEIANIPYSEKINSVNNILNLLKRNRDYIDKLLSPPGPFTSVTG